MSHFLLLLLLPQFPAGMRLQDTHTGGVTIFDQHTCEKHDLAEWLPIPNFIDSKRIQLKKTPQNAFFTGRRNVTVRIPAAKSNS